MKLYIRILYFLLFFQPTFVFAKVQLPKLISDGMILQRNTEVRIWGWADKGERVSVHFINENYQTTANENGEWKIQLKEHSAGGPHTMKIISSDTIVIENILFGDVWICSGQSNMNYRLSGSKSIYQNEIAQSANSEIRSFKVPEVFNFTAPQKNTEGGKWIEANPETVLNFSAVAYFFAVELYKKYQIPIGLIHSSKSGSPAQAWISKNAIKQFPHYYNEAVKYEDYSLIEKIMNEEKLREEKWYNTLKSNDKGYQASGSWFNPNTDTFDWDTMRIPGDITPKSTEKSNGVFWFKKEVNIPTDWIGKDAIFKMGRLVNSDSVYINGVFVGTTSHQWSSRSYNIPSDLLIAGKNTIVLRLVNHSGTGGFTEGYPYQLKMNNQIIDISGDWKYKMGAKMDELPGPTQFSWKATGLYNGMIAPLTNYKIKGAIWYQGEGNAGKPKEYESLFPCMINDWRENWNQGDFPFLFVQLANYMKPADKPGPSDWALLRDAQRKTLALSNTGMAVAIDIGVAYDVHPMNKKDVGYRLALEAMRVAYNVNKVVSAGPLFESMIIDGNKIILSFETFGSELKIREGTKLKHFAIAGADKNFRWAEAKIKNNKIIVSHPGIEDPVAVRYAWANNPESANLVNSEGLPASPFRTDSWEK
jgi:sialate O-acetylesterase